MRSTTAFRAGGGERTGPAGERGPGERREEEEEEAAGGGARSAGSAPARTAPHRTGSGPHGLPHTPMLTPRAMLQP